MLYKRMVEKNNIFVNKDNEKKDKQSNGSNELKIWGDSEVKLLKKWAEMASSYRVLHDRAYRKYRHQNYWFTIPVIIFSTILGTASFSQSTFPIEYQSYIPMGIGSLNIISGIITTIAQFTRVSELSEANRVASISYGKFSRNIVTELSLPPEYRTYNGIDFVQICRTEFDRLIEQSPNIPLEILQRFLKEHEHLNITKPDITTVQIVEEYKPTKEEKTANIIANAAMKFVETKKNAKSDVHKIAEMVNKKGIENVNNINHHINTPVTLKSSITTGDQIKEIIKNNNNEIINNMKEGNLQIKQMNSFVKKSVDERNEELKNISENGIVSKILSVKNNSPVSNIVTGIIDFTKKNSPFNNNSFKLNNNTKNINKNENIGQHIESYNNIIHHTENIEINNEENIKLNEFMKNTENKIKNNIINNDYDDNISDISDKNQLQHEFDNEIKNILNDDIHQLKRDVIQEVNNDLNIEIVPTMTGSIPPDLLQTEDEESMTSNNTNISSFSNTNTNTNNTLPNIVNTISQIKNVRMKNNKNKRR